MSYLSHIVEKKVSQLLLHTFQVNQSSSRFAQRLASRQANKMTEKAFLPQRVLVLRKFSRLEYERLCHPNLDEEQLAANVSHRISCVLTKLPELAYTSNTTQNN